MDIKDITLLYCTPSQYYTVLCKCLKKKTLTTEFHAYNFLSVQSRDNNGQMAFKLQQ